MIKTKKLGIGLSVLIIAVGTGWLLNETGVMPGVNWIWTGILGIAGAMLLVLAGLNQLTILVGPFLVSAAVLSLLRQAGYMPVRIEIPILVVVAGVLLLLSHILPLRMPAYLEKKSE